jgi:hypothetical protein
MVSKKKSLLTIMLVVSLLSLAGGVAASGIQAVYGDEIPISGYATSGPFVYLFLTGPNLPDNGVALNDITRRADQGGFTKVSVDGDDHWSYTWHTGSINGRLDEGSYTIWVVSGPNDRSHLAEADYRTIDVTLGKPFVSVDTPTPVPSGGMNLQSVPDGASLMVNGEYRGKTPLTLSGLSADTYNVTFTRFGYKELSFTIPVEQGKISEVTATLEPKTGTLVVNSTPAGARVLLDGTYAGLSPVVLGNISADNHTATLEMDGYITTSREFSIPAGQVGTVEVSLDPVPVSTTPRAAGLVPATAGAFCVLLLGIAYGRRRNP